MFCFVTLGCFVYLHNYLLFIVSWLILTNCVTVCKFVTWILRHLKLCCWVVNNEGGGVSDLPSSAARQCLSKPVAQSCVYCWGAGTLTPTKLPLPNSDTHITQVSTGRTQKAAVTKTGRLLVWEVVWLSVVWLWKLFAVSLEICYLLYD